MKKKHPNLDLTVFGLLGTIQNIKHIFPGRAENLKIEMYHVIRMLDLRSPRVTQPSTI